jgi:hypothetical protein
MAMNEKFNKDEVWGHLGRSNGQFDDDTNHYEDIVLEDDEISPGNPEAKVQYYFCQNAFCNLPSVILTTFSFTLCLQSLYMSKMISLTCSRAIQLTMVDGVEKLNSLNREK